jgi:hypothetical protein
MEPRSQEDPSKELERLAEEQLSDLESEGQERVRSGKRRRERVAALYAAGAVQSPEDHYYAALVMLYGEEPSHFDLARRLARTAAHDGEERAWSVFAAAWDRSLIARGQPQRFGTQFVREHGHWSLGGIDEQTTDAERAFYAVPPLWVQRQNLEQIRRREEAPGE